MYMYVYYSQTMVGDHKSKNLPNEFRPSGEAAGEQVEILTSIRLNSDKVYCMSNATSSTRILPDHVYVYLLQPSPGWWPWE